MTAKEQNGKIGLSPPEVEYYNQIKYSIGNDSHVKIGPYKQASENLAVITLKVKGAHRARALATLLALSLSIGNIGIQVVVKTSSGKTVTPIQGPLTPKQIAKLYRIAFHSNRFFKTVKTREIFENVLVYPIFKARIVQFYNDNISDYYNNYNNVAAFVFRNVLRNEIDGTTIQFSTQQL